MQSENREEQKLGKPNLTALRLQALSGDNGGDSAAPSVTDPGDQEDPASVLDAIGEIASDRVAATAKAEVPPFRVGRLAFAAARLTIWQYSISWG